MKPYVLVIALLLPAFSFAQSPVSQYSSVVSVRELALPPKAARALEKGTALLLKNNPQASVSYFQTAIALAPDSFHAYHNVAIAHYRLIRGGSWAEDVTRSLPLRRCGVSQEHRHRFSKKTVLAFSKAWRGFRHCQ